MLKTIKSRDVHFVRFWFTDVMGTMKSFAVIPSELENAFADGMGFDGSCIEGFALERESDMLAFPDASTFQVLPWRPESNAVGRMFCDIRKPDGSPFEGDPRHVLAQTVERAADRGYVFNVGPELEYYYFKDPTDTKVLDTGGYFDLTTLDYASDLRRDTVLTLEKMGIPVEYSHHELGPSQHEIDLRYDEALAMADAVMTYKMVVKEIAIKHGVHASFMPKPMTDASGSAMHVHQSLFDLDGRNAFYDPEDPEGYCLSTVAKSYIAGLLKYAPEFCLVTNQTVNSYKRLMGDPKAPVRLSWARSDRTSLVRIPGYRPNCERTCRVELRSPDPAANPYLAFAVMLSAGLAGIEEGLQLMPSADDSDGQTGTLPQTLGEAVELFAESELMKKTLGEHIHSYLVEAKREEWREYQSCVSQWERDRYLAVL